MASILSWAANTAKNVERQVNPFDGGATASHPAARPVQAAPAPQQYSQLAQQRIMARNPNQGMQQIQRGPIMPNMNNMPHFNPVTAGLSSAGDAVKGLGNSFVNTAQVPYSAARVASANITGNKKALQNAHKALASDTSNNIAWNDAYRQTANELAGAAYAPTYNRRITQSNNQAGATIAKAYGNTPRAKLYGSLVAEAGKNQDLNRYLNDVGLTQDTSRLATGLRLGTPIVSAGAQTALQATGIGAGGQIAKEAAAQAAGKMTAKQIAKQAEAKLVKNALGYGAANAGISTLAPIAAGDTNAADYAKAITTGALSGMALPVLGAGAGKLAGTKAGQEVANALAVKTAGIKNIPKNLPNPIAALRSVANTPQAIAHEHLNATDPYYAGYNDQINQLQQAHARNAANGMAPGNATQVNLRKSIDQLGAKTADMRNAVLQNTKANIGSKLGLKPLDSAGSASGDSPLMPFNKPIANAAEKLQNRHGVNDNGMYTEGRLADSHYKPTHTAIRDIPDTVIKKGDKVALIDQNGLSAQLPKPVQEAGFTVKREHNLNASDFERLGKSQPKPLPKAPATATPVSKKIVSSEGSIAPELKSLNDNELRSKFYDLQKRGVELASNGNKTEAAKLLKAQEPVLAEMEARLTPATGTAPSTKPKPILPTAVVPTRKTLPKVSGEKPVGVSLPKSTTTFTPQPHKGIYVEPKGKAKSQMNVDTYASTFGVSKAQAAKDIAEASKAPKTKPIPKQKPALATAAENTAKNPVKVNIPAVEAGNFEQARINPQLASHPIQFATGQLLSKTKKLGLNTSTFGKMVEGTIKPSTQAEADAVKAYRDLADRVHATSQSLGGNTPYVSKYFRHEWDLSDPAKAAEFDKYAQKLPNHGTSDNPFKFEGLDRQPRVFKTIAQGEALGFKLKNQNLADEIKNYGSGSAHALRQQALSKALTEADMNAETKPHTFDLGGGKNVLLSDKAMREAKGYAKNMASDNVGVKAYRKSNRGFKQILLSVSQFHPINISVLRASPTLAAEGHPLRAAKGVFDTFAAQASPKYSEKLQAAALRDGTIEDSARMGTPIKFGSDYKTEGQIGFGKGGLGEKAIFERAMPAEHIQMVKAAKQDLLEKGLSLDSPEAHALGTRINEIMGFINTEARNLDKGTQRRLGDIFLAPQFTRSKWATNKAAVSTGGLAGSYARSAAVANVMASAFVAMGVGYALHQKSDNLNDLLLRAVFHPSVPTPFKDKKGNTIELGLPATQTSEVLGLLGFSLKRGSDQHLHVDWKGGNIPTNVANYGRSRLAVVPANALKVATNTDYAGKPLYDPNADTKTKVEQGATTVSTGLLPIGGQGIAQTKLVKSHLPSGVQQVLNANTPGTNPMLKSAAASFGLTPRTDKTVGKGQQTTQYFDALNQAKSGLNANDKSAFDSIHQQSKNPVTGSYQVNPTIYNSQHTATTYLNSPKVLAADNKLNHTLKAEGQQIDPFFNLNPDQQNIALNYQALAQGDYRRSNMLKAYPFLNQLQADRTAFFDSLPQGTNTDSSGNSKAQLPDNLQYPTLTASEQSLVDKYYNAPMGEKKALLNDPAMAAAVSKVKNYSANIASTRRIPTADQIPGSTPPVPKDPNSTRTGTSMKTTYDPLTNTWTQVSSKTGRTTKIAADGTRTVVNAGTRSRSTGRRRSSGTGTRRSTKLATSSFKTPRINTQAKAFKTGSLKTPKFKSTHTSIPKVAKLKIPTVTVRKRAIA